MTRSKYTLGLASASLLLACSSSSSSNETTKPGVDAKEWPREAGPKAGPEAGPDQNQPPPIQLPGKEVGGETSGAEVEGPDGAGQESRCLWQIQGGGWYFSHFRFRLTTPDGQQQSPPSRFPPDAGAQPIDGGAAFSNDIEGRIVSRMGGDFTVDTCVLPASCQPNLYRFSTDKADSISMPIWNMQRVRVVWHMDNDVPGFCPGLYFLAIYDAEPGPTKGNILFLGSGGRDGGTHGPATNPLKDLPFTTTTRALGCGGRARDASMMKGDDYAFVFAAGSGPGAPLELATGQSGSLDVPSPGGGTQRLEFHTMTAVQPAATDDYWNWDFWVAGQMQGIAPDAGTRD